MNTTECSGIRTRAQAYLANIEPESDHDESSQVEDEGESQAGRRFTTAEDAELIRLMERVDFQIQWHAILQAFRQKFPTNVRSVEGLRERYTKVLMEDAIGRYDASEGYSEKMRRRGLAYIDRPVRKEQQTPSRTEPMANAISLLSDDEESGTHDDDVDSDDEGSDEEAGEKSSQTVQYISWTFQTLMTSLMQPQG